MKHPFAIGSTIQTACGHHLVVLGYVETPMGGEVITCGETEYPTFDNTTRVFHGDPSLYTEAVDPLDAIAIRGEQEYFRSEYHENLRAAIRRALDEAMAL